MSLLSYSDYQTHVTELTQAALKAASPRNAVSRYLRREGRLVYIGHIAHDLEQGRVYLVSVGKAAAPMAEAALEILGDALFTGVVIAKKGSATTVDLQNRALKNLAIFEGNHPVPGEDSLEATLAVVNMLSNTDIKDLVICLISGGTSALLTQPILPLDDWQALTNALLASGCTINELNTVRRQFDRIKGGGLAFAAAPAKIISLILSDVIGNPLEAIGSGPTVLTDEEFSDAQLILDRYDLETRLEPSVWESIQQAQTQIAARPLRNFVRSDHVIVGDVRQAAMAVLARAMQLGFVTQLLTTYLEGEAREVGRVVAAIAKECPPGRCVILGGETTVTLRGDGLGGRNQELALAAAIALDGWSSTVVASLATDGEDGPTTAAGAVVSGETVGSAVGHNLDPIDFLERNDSFHFFQSLDEYRSEVPDGSDNQPTFPACHLVTGSTGTNVNDIVFILTYSNGLEIPNSDPANSTF